jgi:hypothetical protein
VCAFETEREQCRFQESSNTYTTSQTFCLGALLDAGCGQNELCYSLSILCEREENTDRERCSLFATGNIGAAIHFDVTAVALRAIDQQFAWPRDNAA